MNKGFKRALISIVMMVFLVSGIGCNQSSDESNASNKPSVAPTTGESIELTIATQETGAVLDNLKEIISDLEDKQPGLKFKLTTYDSSVYRNEKLPAMMSANTPPDIFVMFGGTDLEKYVSTGNLLDLTGFLVDSGLDQKFINLEDASIDGKVYRLPLAMYAEGLYVNKKLLQSLNASVPEDTDQFVALLESAKKAGLTPLGMTAKDGWATTMLINTMWVRSAGIDATQKLASGTLKWTDPSVLSAFKQYESYVKNGYLTKGALGYAYGDLQAQFLQGKTLFIYDGSWQAATLDGPQSTLAGQVGFMKFPKLKNSTVNQDSINSANNAGYAVSAKLDDSQKIAAFKLLKQLFGDASVTNLMEKAGQPPAIQMNLDQVTGLSPAFEDVVAAISSTNSIFAALDVYISSDVQATIAENMQKLISGVATAEEVVAAIQSAQDKESAQKK